MTTSGEKAQVELSFCRQARAVAVTAEGLGHARDDANLSRSVDIPPALRRLTCRGRIQWLEGKFLGDARNDLGRWQHLVHAPPVGGSHVHVLDEAQDHAAVPEMPGHRNDFVVVGAALDHHVYLDRAEPGALCSVDAGKHLGHREIDIVHSPEDGVVQAVEADGDALQAGVSQRLSLLCQQGCVGGEGQVDGSTLWRAQRAEHPDQRLEALAQQRLTASQADLAHAVGDEDARGAHDLLEVQQRGLWQKGVATVEHLLGHAVAATEVAPVRDRDAQVAQRAAEGVDQEASGRLRDRRDGRHGGRIALLGDRDDLVVHARIVPTRLGPPGSLSGRQWRRLRSRGGRR